MSDTLDREALLAPLLRALCAAQAEMKPAVKETVNPHLRSKYANLASVWEALRGPLTRHGLVVTHTLIMSEEQLTLTTALYHAASGQCLTTDYPLAATRSTGSQQLGAALTYARRYSLLLLVSATTDDDDDDDGHSTRQPVRAPEPRRAPAVREAARPAPEGSTWRADTTDELRAAMAPAVAAAARDAAQAPSEQPTTLAELGRLAVQAAASGDAEALAEAYVRSIELASSEVELDAIGAACKAEPLFAGLPRRRPDAVGLAYSARLRALRGAT